MIKKSVVGIFLFNFIFLSGCASLNDVSLTGKNSQFIKTVYVDPEIKKPEEMTVFLKGETSGFMLPTAVGNINVAEATQDFAEKNNVDIRKIVYQRWMKQLQQNSKFKLTAHPNDTVLKTEITAYGITSSFSEKCTPILIMTAKLVRDNQTIWQDSARVTIFTSGVPEYTMSEVTDDPTNLSTMWDAAAQKIINKLLDDMNKAINSPQSSS